MRVEFECQEYYALHLASTGNKNKTSRLHKYEGAEEEEKTDKSLIKGQNGNGTRKKNTKKIGYNGGV
jgi:hypothetical protein